MENLIDILKEQHWNISSSCNALENCCKSGTNSENDAFHLKNFKKIVLEHFKLENSSLYPALRQAKDKKTREIVSRYSDEMKLISKRTVTFFETYAHLKVIELSQNEFFKLDLSTVITILKKRFNVEESELFPLYDRLTKK